MTTPEPSSSPIRGYRFELIFSLLFTLYCWICYGVPLNPLFTLPLGFLNFIFLFGLFAKDNVLIFLVAAVVTGFVIGWIIRAMWRDGRIGKIGLITLLIANTLIFYYLLTLTSD